MLYSLFSHRKDLDCNEACPAGGISKGRCNWNPFFASFSDTANSSQSVPATSNNKLPLWLCQGLWLVAGILRWKSHVDSGKSNLPNLHDVWNVRFSAAGFIDDLDVHKLRNLHLSTLHLQISTCFQELSLPSRTDPAWLVEAIGWSCF